MKWLFLLLAKLIVMGFWLGSVYFIFIHPIEGKIHTLIPVFAVFSGVLLLGESVTSWMLICGAVILCGTALSLDLLKLRKS